MASLTANDRSFDIPLEGENREEEDNRTQLEKDIASTSAVIPIWPPPPKDNMDTQEYSRRLLTGKGGLIRHCDTQAPCGSFFWRINNTVEYERFIPMGWVNYGGQSQWTMCPLCKARELQEQLIPDDIRRVQELGRVGHTNQHGTTGSSDGDIPLQNVRTGTTSVGATPGKGKGDLKARARELWENHPEHLEGALQAIDEEERKKEEEEKRRKKEEGEERRKERANAAARRKRKRTGGGKRRRKKRTKKRRKSKGRKRRRKRTRKRRKLRRRKRTRKRRKSRRRKRTRKRR